MYSSHYLTFVEHFNRGEYRACVEPLEELWFVQRDDFHKGLIRLVVGLNQMKLGLESGPRFLLSTAQELLKPYAPCHAGLDVVALLRFIKDQAELIGTERQGSDLPGFTIHLDPAPGDDAHTGIAILAKEA